MNPIGASILVVLILVVLGASRRAALLGMMAGVLYLTEGQQIQVAGVNLFATRFLELAGFLRVMSRREFLFSALNRIDKVLIWLYGFVTVVFLLRSSDGQAYIIGATLDAFLCYFTFRGLIGNLEDFQWFLRAFLVLLGPYTLMILYESFTRHDLFSAMGGVADGAWIRDNRIRCFGSFRQPDLLGMFAASFLPLYVGLACIAKERIAAVLGIICCLLIVWASNAGGAASAAGVGIVGWLFWWMRSKMRSVRWGIASIIVLLALVMKAPVWYIFAHVSSITGGDGWHRSFLLDVTWQHLSRWWLVGMPINDTGGWFAYNLAQTGQADITNQYVAFGINAGAGAIILFILLLKRAFSGLGQAMEAVRTSGESKAAELVLWGLGVMLTVHIINWFGITYFDQFYVVWFMQLAIISTLSELYFHKLEGSEEEQPESNVVSKLRHGDCSPSL